ncbi:MAG TPA: LD-carboxypeptidase [Actinomycetaceae bacterium]|nr:LD-carboxypeptidase [Actinomycetaceae bacterium]
MLCPGSKIAIVNCSDARWERARPRVDRLVEYLEGLGITAKLSPRIFVRYLDPGLTDDDEINPYDDQIHPYDYAHPAADDVRARILQHYFADPEIDAIFDISGGDIANGVLAHLDFDVIRANPKPFFGYSDLSTVVNALHVETGETTYLWQLLHLGTNEYGDARERFERSIVAGPAGPAGPAAPGDLFELEDLSFLQGDGMEGKLVGGNLRAFLKLAGTRWFPDLDGTILAIESLGSTSPHVTTYLTQLGHIGAFERCAGLLIGQHTRLARFSGDEAIEQILADVVPPQIPIAQTSLFGHSPDSRALRIGGHYSFSSS